MVYIIGVVFELLVEVFEPLDRVLAILLRGNGVDGEGALLGGRGDGAAFKVGWGSGEDVDGVAAVCEGCVEGLGVELHPAVSMKRRPDSHKSRNP